MSPDAVTWRSSVRASLTPRDVGPTTRDYGRDVDLYLLWSSFVASLYLASPAVSYLVFWDLIPSISLSTVFLVLLMGTVSWRALLLLLDRMPFQNWVTLGSYTLLLWVTVIQLVSVPRVADHLGLELTFARVAFTVGAWVLLLGGESVSLLTAIRPRTVRRMLVAVYSVLAATIVGGTYKSFATWGQLYLSFRNADAAIFNYLDLADALAVVAISSLIFSNASSWLRKLLFYIATALLLALAYSRASLLGFMFAGLFALVKSISHRKSVIPRLVMVFLIVVVCASVFFAFVSVSSTGQILTARLTSVVDRDDPSIQGRLHLFRGSTDYLARHWLFGSYMYEAIEGSGVGSYVHNWVSFWLAYGLGPFIVSILLISLSVLRSGLLFFTAPGQKSIFPVLLFVAIAIVAARSYIWPYYWFGLALAGTEYLRPRSDAEVPCR